MGCAGPFRRLGVRGGRAALSLGSHGVSHEVGREPARRLYADRSAAHGFTAAFGAHLFPCVRHGSDRPSTRRGPPGFILRFARPLSRAPSPPTPPVPFRVGRPARVSVLFATSPGASTYSRGDSNPRYVPSSGGHSLSTVCSALQLRGLFHPRAAYGTFTVQGFLPPRSTATRRRRLPPCR